MAGQRPGEGNGTRNKGRGGHASVAAALAYRFGRGGSTSLELFSFKLANDETKIGFATGRSRTFPVETKHIR
jgi:hypothetical protein